MTIMFLVLLFAVSFFVVISSLVFFHELGHYSAARFFGVAVERFSIGFGKPIWRRRAKSGTEWVVAAIPLGGYVKFLGDAGAASNPDAEQLAKIRSEIDEKHGVGVSNSVFHFKPLWQRVLVVLAGPIANFILAATIFTGFILAYGKTQVTSVVLGVAENTPAYTAGFEIGDRVLTVNGKDARYTSQLMPLIGLRAGDQLNVIVERNGVETELVVVPKRVKSEDFVGGEAEIGQIGIQIPGRGSDAKYLNVTKYNLATAPFQGIKEVGNSIAHTGTYIGRIFTGKENGKQLGGVLRIAAMTGKTATDGAQRNVPVSERVSGILKQLIYLAGALSIGLGVANLMPIPVLDGGHLLFYGYEAVAGRPLSQDKQEFGFRIGFALILGLFVILTWNDIGYVRSLF